MRKFFSIFVAVAMVLCLCIPAFAADTDSLASLLEGVDVNELSDVELSSILEGLNLEGIDLDSIRESFGGSDSGKTSGVSDALSGITDSIGSGDTSALSGITDSLGSLGGDGATGNASTDSLLSGLTDTIGSLTSDNGEDDPIKDGIVSGISSLFGGMDMSWLDGVVSNPESLLAMFESGGGAPAGGFDFGAIMEMISGAFGGNGLDIGALTSGMDLGSFDIASVLGGLGGGNGGGAIASGISDKVAGISDMLKSGLQSMGLDPSIADKLLDNEIVNFFANLFIGLGDLVSGNGDIGSVVGGLIGGDSDSSGSSGGSSDYSAPVTPNTGDNGAVFAALGVLTAASCAAFVCLKKKKA